jgi:hypothetical protein
MYHCEVAQKGKAVQEKASYPRANQASSPFSMSHHRWYTKQAKTSQQKKCTRELNMAK